MNETLWLTIPTNDENALKNVISLIASKNLPSLSIKDLVEKLKKNEAADWIAVLTEYNEIPSLGHNIPHEQMLSRSKSVMTRLERKGLEGRVFEPRELLSLVIMSYSNPSLIGPGLREALDENDNAGVKEQMIEFSAYDSHRDRMIPEQSNFRLLSTALYFNDTDIRLPQRAIDRVTRETIRDRRTVITWDQRGGVEEVIDGAARARSADTQEITPRKKRNVSKLDSHKVLQSLQPVEFVAEKNLTQSQLAMPASAPQIGYPGNGSELVTEPLALYSTNNAASPMTNGSLAIAGLVGLHIFRNLPVITPVMNNIGKDLKRGSQYLESFFSKNIESEQQESTVLSPTARS